MEKVQKMLDRFGSDLSKYPTLVKAEEKTNCPKQYLVLSVASGLLLCLLTSFGASLIWWIGCLLLCSLLWKMSLGLVNLVLRDMVLRDMVKPLRLALLNKGLLKLQAEGLRERLLGSLLETLLVELLVLLVELMVLVILLLVMLLLLLLVLLMWLGPMRLKRLLGR